MQSDSEQEVATGSKDTLEDTTGLLLQWLPRDYGSPIPECYLDRLSTWAKIENQRLIKLVINRSGFTPEQYKKLEDKISDKKFNQYGNIELIDFNKFDLKEYDFSFHAHTNLWINKAKFPKYTISEYYSQLYSIIPQEERVNFAVEIDTMRMLTLYAIDSPIIYLDFDIFPKKDYKIGKIIAEKGCLFNEVVDTTSTDNHLENSIIAVGNSGKNIIAKICNDVKLLWTECYLDLRHLRSNIYHITTNAVDVIIRDLYDHCPINNYTSTQEYNNKLHEWEKGKRPLIHKIFGFQTNGGNVITKYEHSWYDNYTCNDSNTQNDHIQSTCIKLSEQELSHKNLDALDNLELSDIETNMEVNMEVAGISMS
ncbi:hypothetical protein [Orientia tsutsugamushi]|uniref:Hypotheical protein n=1 Tax=Orientia tsutsugamushi (strain Boryong) TaxID=357244 RepID=A5CFF2_ORITB|nr:hypothetical protein [Orientia tsutsugamushi]CAM81109.1 hypotheical protein [Orientia tsutsugamushi str. Boryong]